MQFNTLEGLEKVAELLGQADFEEAGCRWDSAGAVFTVSAACPADGDPHKPAGLLRKGVRDWVPCRLVFRQVKELTIRHEQDAKPAEKLIRAAAEGKRGTRVYLSSARGLVIELALDRLDGSLEE